jgi:hypothetical protein
MLALTCAAMVLRRSGKASRIAALGAFEAERDGAPGTVRLEFVGAVAGERPVRVGQGEPRRFGRVGDREAGRLPARELGITRTDREALGPLPEGFSRCCPQPGYRCGWMFLSTSARVSPSVPRPHAISPELAAPAHAARARCRRPAAQCPAPVAARVTAGTAADTHSSVPEGLAPSRVSRRATRSGDGALLSSRAIPALLPRRLGCAKPGLAAGPADRVAQVDERSVICTPGQGQLPRQEPAGQQWRATAQRGWRDTDDHLV